MLDVIRNLGSIFFSPREVAIRVSQNPHWLLPLIVIVVVNLAIVYFTYPLQVEFFKENVVRSLKDRGMDDENIENSLKMMSERRLLNASLGGIFGTIITVIIASAILNLLSPLIGTKVGFKGMFAYFCYVFWITAVGGIIRMILMFAKGTYDIRTSVAAFAPNLSPTSSLGALLSSFDLFTIWTVCAMGIGYAELAKTTRRKSFGLILILWAVLIAISVAVTSIKGQSY